MPINIKELAGRNLEIPCQNTTNEGNASIPAREFFPQLNPNILLMARKQSGKTTLVYNIIKSYIRDLGKDNMKVIIYSPSVDKNNVWLEIQKLLDDNEISYVANSFFKGHSSTGRKYNMLNQFEKTLEDSNRPKETYLMIYDDLGNEMRDKMFTNLLSKNRHYNLVTINCVHSLTDVQPKSISNYDYILIYPNISEKRLKELHEKTSMNLSLPTFMKIYKYVTSEPYNFLYYQAEPECFRHNFNKLIKIDEDE